ncbi:MAG: 3-oxoadipate enol-lactonase [Desulfobacteraceae bacterium]|jgi:3-oxoadipate enol-lactonase
MQIEANGIKMNYELSGKMGAPHVMLSHSLGSSLVMWDPQLAVLEPHYQVLRYDTRGHGGSDAPSGAYTLEMLGRDALGLIDALGIDKLHFIGLSMGGMIGQYLALNHANRLESLVLCDTAAILPKEAQPIWKQRIQLAREKGLEALVDETLERWFTPSFLAQSPPEVQSIHQQFLATPMTGYMGCSEAIRGLNYLERLSEIKIPTLIMVGEEDPGTPVAAAEAMHQRIAGSTLVVLPSAAHLSNVEQTATFNTALLSFLQQRQPTT